MNKYQKIAQQMEQIHKLALKYRITIMMQYGNDAKVIISNKHESHIIETGFYVNQLEKIEELGKKMLKYSIQKAKERDEKISKFDWSKIKLD